MMECEPNSPDDGDHIGAVGEVLEPQKAFQLLHSYHNGRRPHEPHDCGMRKEVHHETQSVKNKQTKTKKEIHASIEQLIAIS